MTCPYLSKLNETEIFCQTYGKTKVSAEKMKECHSNYAECFKVAGEYLRNEAEKRRISGQVFFDISDCVENEFNNLFQIDIY